MEMNKTKTVFVAGVCIGLLFGWVLGYYQMKCFFYDPTCAKLTALTETLENTKREYRSEIERIKSQKVETENTAAELRDTRKKYDNLIGDLHKQIAEQRITFYTNNPFLTTVIFVTVVVIIALLIWMMMESNENKRTLERLASINPELIEKLTAHQLPKGKVIDAISSPSPQKTLPEEKSPDMLPKD